MNYKISEGSDIQITVFELPNALSSDERITESQLAQLRKLQKKHNSFLANDYIMYSFVSKKLASKIIEYAKSFQVMMRFEGQNEKTATAAAKAKLKNLLENI